jgi:hypothetical protein
MRDISLLNGRAGFVAAAALGGMLTLATPAAAADYVAPPPPAAAALVPYAAPGYVEAVPVVPVPVYRPYVVGAPYWYGRPYRRGYWGPRYAGGYGRPWGWRHY